MLCCAPAGVSGRDQEDAATLLTSSWRKMRSLVLQKRNVQEFQFRQYLFAAQVGLKALDCFGFCFWGRVCQQWQWAHTM